MEKLRELRYLCQEEKEKSRALYEEMFPEDEEAFVDAYYRIKAAANRILVLEEQKEMLSMLHLNPYRFWLRGSLVDSSYIVAVATRPQYRHKGCMRRLLTKALKDLYQEKQPFAFLMPAKEAIYTPFGFRRMENRDDEALGRIPLEELKRDYDLFVWKDEIYESQQIPDQEWETTPMMVRIVNLRALLSHIGTEEKEGAFLRIQVEDELLPENAGAYDWILGREGSRLEPSKEPVQGTAKTDEPRLTAPVAELGSFLFGVKNASEAFPHCSMSILQKLEKVQVIKKIFINETV